jgi:class 3 adenylate cyclase
MAPNGGSVTLGESSQPAEQPPSPAQDPAPREMPPVDQPPSLTRGFLFADLRSYTSYVEQHGDHAGARLLERYRTLVRAAVAAARGAEIKTEGDSFYVVFDSASAAVRCGLAIVGAAAETAARAAETAAVQGAAAAAQAADHAAAPIEVGVGVHAGETVATAEGFVGSAVNIAARLCAQAKAGEVVVSETVRSLTRTYLDVDFVPLGSRRLKGVEEPIAIYRVAPRGTVPARAHPRPAAGRRRWWAAGAALVVLVLALGAAGAFALGGTGASPTAAPSVPPSMAPATPAPTSAAPSAAVSPTGAAGGYTEAEQALLARIPSDFQPYCSRSSLEKGALGGSASIRCDLQPGTDGYGADTVWYDQFDTPGTMDVAMRGKVQDAHKLQLGDCGPDVSNVIGRWEMGITYTGKLACYTTDDGAWVAWTYEGANIAVRAKRNDGDVKTLYEWWKDASQYLRG